MNTPCDCPCSPEVVAIPGLEGTDGINAFTYTTASFVVPALDGLVTVSVLKSVWMGVGQTLWVETAGLFTVISLPNSLSAILQYYNFTGNTASGNTISAGSKVSPAGLPGTGSGFGGQQIYSNSGNPNGVVTPTTTLPCMCIDIVNSITWYKTDGVISNTGWGGP